jgi:hypothetical protein
MTVKAMRERIAQAKGITILSLDYNTSEKAQALVGATYPITKHQKNGLRMETPAFGGPFWISLDRIVPTGDDTFETYGVKGTPAPGRKLGTYRLAVEVTECLR